MKTNTISKRIIETHKDMKNNAITFEMELAHMPEQYVAIAKKLDGGAYSETCFAFQYKFSIAANRFFVSNVNGKETYYIDENGDRHYMDFKIPKNVMNIATEQCNKQLQKMGIKKVRKARTQARKAQTEIKPIAAAAQNTPVKTIICQYKESLIKSTRRRMVSGQLALF